MINAIWNRKGPRRALITGASAGVGEALAHHLAEEGWELVLAGRNETELYRVAGVVNAHHDVDVRVVATDLARSEGVDALMARLEERDWLPDVLVHAAGMRLAGRVLDLPRTDQLRLLDLNVRATADLTLRLLPHMRAQKAGGVLFVASPGAFVPGPGRAVFHAGGAWVVSFAEALSEEVRADGLNVSVLCRGIGGESRYRRENASVLARLFPAMRPDVVARAGWQGFKEGRVVIVPGLVNRLLVQALRLVPRVMVRRLAAWWFRP